jgi:hypothetical protein
LHSLSEAEVEQLHAALEAVEAPLLEKEIVLAAERRLQGCPCRRTQLLETRIARRRAVQNQLNEKADRSRESLERKQAKLQQVAAELAEAADTFKQWQDEYSEQGRPERPHSRLAKARKKLEMLQKRWLRCQKACEKSQNWHQKQLERALAHQDLLDALQVRLIRFQQENAQNNHPLQAVIRLDAGFGTAENIALLIEMGYEVYTKPYGNWLKGELRRRRQAGLSWQKVGHNADMLAWKQVQLDGCPYPLNLACERFWTGRAYRHTGLLHFGQDPVCDDLPAWFHFYNARQTIEAGNRELRQVFEAHHLKVRARPALRLQEYFALLAANFVRYASLWLAEQCPQVPDGWKESTRPKVKQQVKVGAHTSAWVSWFGQDCLLRFSDLSIFAGRSFEIKRSWAFQPVLPFLKNCFFSPT